MSTTHEANSPTLGETHVTLQGHGESIDTMFNNEPSRTGTIEPYTSIDDYRVGSPKVLLATNGAVTINGAVHMPGEFLTLPVNTAIQLSTAEQGFDYISRKASSEIFEDTKLRIAALANRGIGDSEWWQLPRDEQFDRLQKVIGNTPMETVTVGNTEVAIKRECDNPSGSHYDRAYFDTIKHFEKIGFIKPGDELRDITSGSAGNSLALIAQLLGYKSRVIVPSELPASRIYPMLAFGATVMNAGNGYVPAACEMQTEEIAALRAEESGWDVTRPEDRSGRAFLFESQDQRICYLNHSENELSPKAFEAIGAEILAELPDTTHVALAKGNWTTIRGIVAYLREAAPHIQIIGYKGELTEDGTTTTYGTDIPSVPKRFEDPSLLHHDILVTDAERDSIQNIAPHLGRSSLMGLWVAKTITDADASAKVVTIGYDLANRY